MRFAGKATLAGLTLSLLAGTAWAADVCARAPDLVALQVAALQQQLMVAALTCNDVPLYNSFVTTYQKDLVESDMALEAFFDQFDGDGSPAYHTFKTKMANVYSARSAADKNRFCAGARAAFAPALKAEKLNLASFAMSLPSTVNEPYTNCGESVAGGATVTRTPVVAPAALPSNLLTAQNAAAAVKAAPPVAAPPAEDKPLGVGLRAAAPREPAPVAQAPASSAAVTAANPPAPPPNQTTNRNYGQEQSAPRSTQGRYASDAYRERLAQQQQQPGQAADQQAQQQQ